MVFQEIIDILSRRVNTYIEYLQPRINRTEFINKTFTFGNVKIEKVLNKMSSVGDFRLHNEEATNGIHHHHDIVNKDRKEILNGNFEVGQGIFVLSEKEKKSISFSRKELELIKPEYTTKELFKYYANPKNKAPNR
mgnify:CR=1 FL=1